MSTEQGKRGTFATADGVARLRDARTRRERAHGRLLDLVRSADPGASREFRLAALNLLEDIAEAERKSQEAESQRARAEADVRASEDRYRALFTQMDQALGIAQVELAGDVAVDFRWLDVNPQFEKLTGFARGDVIQPRSMREVVPRLEPEWLEMFGRVARTGQLARFERRSDFLDRWLEVNAFRLGEPSQRQVVVLMTDVTHRARHASNLALQMALAEDWSRAISAEAVVRIASARLANHLGVRGCEIVDDTPEAAARDRLREIVVPVGRVGERQLALAVTNAKDREWTTHELDLVRSVAWQMHPVLQRAAAEDALRVSRERLRLIVENARDYAILTVDLERRITGWNPGAEQLTGYAEHEVLGKSADILFTAEGRAAGAPEREAATAIKEGRASDERWHVRKDGSRFWGSGSMLAMRNEAGEAVGLLKIFRDRTAELRATETLERSRRELWDALQETERARKDAEAAGRAKDQLLAVLSHELRTPLTPVMFGTEMLLMREDIDAAAREALLMVQRNVALEARLVDDLLDVTRIRHGKVELIFSAMNVHDAVRQAVEVAAPDLDARKQRLVVALEAKKAEVMGDVTRLKQVIWNVLKNASKFTPDGREVRVSTRNEPGRIVIEVADTGIGIDPSMLGKIFDAFTQVDASMTRSFGGLGLGLAIAKGIVERHGGQIEAHSRGLGHGATFTIGLPLADATGPRSPS